TLTAGIIYQPAWLDGFSASIDWYDIDINKALAQLAAQDIVDGCRNGDMSLCQYVITPNGPVANPGSNEFLAIDRVEALFLNLDNQHISGVDVEARYSTDLNLFGNNAESLSWRFLYSYLSENSIQTAGGSKDD